MWYIFDCKCKRNKKLNCSINKNPISTDCLYKLILLILHKGKYATEIQRATICMYPTCTFVRDAAALLNTELQPFFTGGVRKVIKIYKLSQQTNMGVYQNPIWILQEWFTWTRQHCFRLISFLVGSCRNNISVALIESLGTRKQCVVIIK